ncbi:DNA primase [subsurface metagenome]
MAHQFGCSNVVATLGTSFTAGHARILRRYAKKIVLLFDSDTAGIEAANRALEICLAQRIDIKLASVPEAKDPCDFLLSAGKEQFERLVEGAVDVFQFKWNRLIERFTRDDTLVDNKAAIEEFLQTIAMSLWAGNLPAIDRGLIVNRLSKIISADPKEINAELCRSRFHLNWKTSTASSANCSNRSLPAVRRKSHGSLPSDTEASFISIRCDRQTSSALLAASIPAVSLSKIKTTFFAYRRKMRPWPVVKLVPNAATTLLHPN